MQMIKVFLATQFEQLSPEHIAAFKGLSAEALLGLCFFVLLTIVMPLAVYLIARAYTKSMQAISDAFMKALDKRDDDQKKITETLEKVVVGMAMLESKVDRLNPTP